MNAKSIQGGFKRTSWKDLLSQIARAYYKVQSLTLVVLVCYGQVVVLYHKDLCDGCLTLHGTVDMVEL